MVEVLQILLSIVETTPIPSLLVIGGLVFIFFSIVDVARFKVPADRKKTAAAWGIIMLLAGILLVSASAVSTAMSAAPSTITSTWTSQSTFTITPQAAFTPTITPTLTLSPTQTLTLSPTQSCDQLKIDDAFKVIVTSPEGLSGNPTVGNQVPQLRQHVPITWEPSYCPLTVQINTGGVRVLTYESKPSSEVNTQLLMKDYPFESGAWIEIQLWIPRTTQLVGNLHIKLP